MPGPLAGWPNWEIGTFGSPQHYSYAYTQSRPAYQANQVQGGRPRLRMTNKLSGRIYDTAWQFTTEQMVLFREFYATTLKSGEYPFQIELLEGSYFVWKAAQFFGEPTETPLSPTVTLVSAQLLVQYFPAHLIKPGAVYQGVQVRGSSSRTLRPGDLLTVSDPFSCLGIYVSDMSGNPTTAFVAPSVQSAGLNTAAVVISPTLAFLDTCDLAEFEP